MSRPLPYVGVTGFTTRAQVDAAVAAFAPCPACFGFNYDEPLSPGPTPKCSACRGTSPALMIGVLASPKSLSGDCNARSPRPEEIAELFPDDQRALNLLHFYSPTPPTWEVLVRLLDLAGPRCNGFQFNGAWPLEADLLALVARVHRLRHPRLRLVLQLRGWPPATFPREATDILVDASGGRGLPINLELARDIVRTIRAAYPDFGVGIAGRLSAVTLLAAAPLVREYGLSTDTETAVRTPADELDLEKVRAYLRAAGEVLRG